MVNATFAESENTSECNDVFCKSLVRSAKKLFEVKKFVAILEQWSKPTKIWMLVGDLFWPPSWSQKMHITQLNYEF